MGQWWAHLVGALRVHPHKHYANYPPQKIEELMNVRGVGEKNFLKLKPQIVVTMAKAEHQL